MCRETEFKSPQYFILGCTGIFPDFYQPIFNSFERQTYNPHLRDRLYEIEECKQDPISNFTAVNSYKGDGNSLCGRKCGMCRSSQDIRAAGLPSAEQQVNLEYGFGGDNPKETRLLAQGKKPRKETRKSSHTTSGYEEKDDDSTFNYNNIYPSAFVVLLNAAEPKKSMNVPNICEKPRISTCCQTPRKRDKSGFCYCRSSCNCPCNPPTERRLNYDDAVNPKQRFHPRSYYAGGPGRNSGHKWTALKKGFIPYYSGFLAGFQCARGQTFDHA